MLLMLFSENVEAKKACDIKPASSARLAELHDLYGVASPARSVAGT
jgi:hypothetical protein